MLTLDGSFGEGGGQILRSSLALSMVTGTPFRLENIRAGRKMPGVMRQHLTAVQAAAAISGAGVEGAAVGSTALSFFPGTVRPGDYEWSVGTAGSTTLVLQTVLPALVCAGGPSRLTLGGGTHNPHAPPFDFLARVFAPLVRRMGPGLELTLERPGFFPAGGGRFTAVIEPAARLAGFDLPARGDVRRRRARAIVAALPRHIADREISLVRERTGWRRDEVEVEIVENARGPGNLVMLEVETDEVTEIFTGFGAWRVPAETVATRAVQAYRRYLEADVPVGEYLADQLMLPLALAGRGSFRTLPLSRHATTHLELIGRFLDVPVTADACGDGATLVRIGSGAG